MSVLLPTYPSLTPVSSGFTRPDVLRIAPLGRPPPNWVGPAAAVGYSPRSHRPTAAQRIEETRRFCSQPSASSASRLVPEWRETLLNRNSSNVYIKTSSSSADLYMLSKQAGRRPQYRTATPLLNPLSLGASSSSFAALSRSASSAAILDPSFGGPRMPTPHRFASPPKYRQH
jgi:hypothetical protein